MNARVFLALIVSLFLFVLFLNKLTVFIKVQSSFLSALHSFESTNVILANFSWVTVSGRMVFVALFQTFEHSSTLWFRNVKWSTGEVGCEEISEGSSLGHGSRHHTYWGGSSPGIRSWWSVEVWALDAESLHVWVLKVTLGNDPSSLEWMTDNHSWMGMICRWRERSIWK